MVCYYLYAGLLKSIAIQMIAMGTNVLSMDVGALIRF